MSAPDPREVLAERLWDEQFVNHIATIAWAEATDLQRAKWLDRADRLLTGLHLSVDGGPWRDAEGREWEVVLTSNLGPTATLRPVPAGEAEPKRKKRCPKSCDCTCHEGCPDWEHPGQPCPGKTAASSDGPAAPTAEVLDPCPVCGASRFDDPDYGPCAHQRTGQYPGVPVAAPATCDGSGVVWEQPLRGYPCPGCPACDGSGEGCALPDCTFPACTGEDDDLCWRRPCSTCGGTRTLVLPSGSERCPACDPCETCGTVGGGGRITTHATPDIERTEPCPSCGTAPTGGEQVGRQQGPWLPVCADHAAGSPGTPEEPAERTEQQQIIGALERRAANYLAERDAARAALRDLRAAVITKAEQYSEQANRFMRSPVPSDKHTGQRYASVASSLDIIAANALLPADTPEGEEASHG